MTDKPKQTPRGAVAMGLSLHIVNRRAVDARDRSFAAIWMALAALILSAVCTVLLLVSARW